MLAAGIARALGGQRNGKGWLCHCPVPGHGQGNHDRNPSLAVRDGERQLLVTCFAGCDTGEVLAELRARGLLPRLEADEGSRYRPRPRALAEIFGVADTEPVRIDRARRLFSESVDPRDTLAETYFARVRGLTGLDRLADDVLRFHPRCPWKDGETLIRVPAMVAAIRDALTNELVAIQRTALQADGSKLGRRMLGRTRGAAIKLDPDEHVLHGLTIGEGIETTQSARMVGFAPAWAVGSAGGIGMFPVLSEIQSLTILCETDDDGTNLRASRDCADRWLAAGREVLLVKPNFPGDLDDVRAALDPKAVA